MAETKKEPEKKDDPKKTEADTKRQKWVKATVVMSGIVLIFLIVALSSAPHSWSSLGSSWVITGEQIDPRDVGVLHLTTTSSDNVVEMDPDQGIIQYTINTGVEWELSINGIPVKLFPVGSLPIELVDLSVVGPQTNMSARVTEGQTVQTMDLVYAKYRGQGPPKGWYKAALKNQ